MLHETWYLGEDRLSFLLPGFHFHAITAYDIPGTRDVPLGQRDYEGRLRTRST
jgi:uncharacterized protein